MDERDEMLVRAQTVIKGLRARLAVAEQVRDEPVAIVGMACRFPNALSEISEGEDLESFWRMTLAGKSAECAQPEDRWAGTSLTGTSKLPLVASFLKDIDLFDAGFFDIPASEAIEMDPAQRLFLEVAWHALEDAGQRKDRLAGSDTGVFVGHTGFHEYLREHMAAEAEIGVYTGTGNGQDVIAGRLAYFLNLHGPAMTVNTACSSSLVAVHLARRSLLARDCRMAVAGGVNVLGPVSTAFARQMGFMAADGRCKVFDDRADGFGRGEGCGVVVLKRLSDAQADGDPIHAVIHGSAMNQDGRTNGLSAPNGRSQAALMRRALLDAGVAASEVGYVEAHGTGTPLGDLIEFGALAEVYGVEGKASPPCSLGSVKASVGHQEGAAGVAGLIRAALAIEQGVIPPLAGFGKLNRNISLKATRLAIPRHSEVWNRAYKTRYAGVSSFGWSGTNAHVVLGETPAGAGREMSEPATLMMRLPAYPFQRSRYWIPKPQRDAAQNLAPDDWFYETVWIEKPMPLPYIRAGRRGQKWLIFADKNGTAKLFAQTLAERGDSFLLVLPGPELRQIGLSEFRADATDSEQIRLLLQSENVLDADPLYIAHMQSLDLDANGIEEVSAKSSDVAYSVPEMQAYLMSLIELCKGLATRAKHTQSKLWVVTRGAEAVREQDARLCMKQSPIRGFASAAALDHPEFWGGTIDLQLPIRHDDKLVEILRDECKTEDGENRLAYRDGRRFVPRLRRAKVPSPVEFELNPDGTYLVTGAFGGIGLDLAKWLAERGAKHLVLLGRSYDNDGAATETQRVVRELRKGGVTVRAERCDVADFDQMANLFARFGLEGPPLRGILHAAADVVWKPTIELDADDVRRSFQAKVRGSLVMHELTKRMTLDFVVFFSSAAVPIGARNAAAYAAGNSFMDALGSERRVAGLPGLSIQWGQWERRINHTGVAEKQFTQSGLAAMDAAKALNALSRLLRSKSGQSSTHQPMIAQIDVDQLRAGIAARTKSPFLSEVGGLNQKGADTTRPAVIAALDGLSKADQVQALTLLVSEQLRRAMDWSSSRQLDGTRGFFDMGMDSIKSIQFKNYIESATGMVQSSTLVFLHPNIDAVVRLLLKALFVNEDDVEIENDLSGFPLQDATAEQLSDSETHTALLAELELFRGGRLG